MIEGDLSTEMVGMGIAVVTPIDKVFNVIDQSTYGRAIQAVTDKLMETPVSAANVDGRHPPRPRGDGACIGHVTLGELDPVFGGPTHSHFRWIPHGAVDAVAGPLESLGDGTAEPPAGTSHCRRRPSLHFVLFSMG
jgi:hypothetical protein